MAKAKEDAKGTKTTKPAKASTAKAKPAAKAAKPAAKSTAHYRLFG